MKKDYGHCWSCGSEQERCEDCTTILCWACDGIEHEQEHRDHEREREAMHAEVDREYGYGRGGW